MPDVALRQHYASFHVWDIISITLISVTFYRYRDEFLTFSLVDNGNKIQIIIDLLSFIWKNLYLMVIDLYLDFEIS